MTPGRKNSRDREKRQRQEKKETETRKPFREKNLKSGFGHTELE